MKKTVWFIIFLLIIPLASAVIQTHPFFVGDSYTIAGKNITLVAIGDEDSIVACVNNQKKIIRDGDILNNVEFDIKQIQDNYVELKLKVPSTTVCDESCSNNLCFPEEQTSETITDVECTQNSDCQDNNECTTDECINNFCVHAIHACGSESKNKSNIGFIFSIILLILVIILLLVLFLKKSKKKR